MTILEISSNLVDRMHIEGAIFQSVNAIKGVGSFESLRGGVEINESVVTISDDGSFFEVDLSSLPKSDKVASRMETIIDKGRYFPESYESSTPLDNITPTSNERSIPGSASSFIDDFRNWIRTCVSKSVDTEKETGIYQDSMDNTIGVVHGTESSITWPMSIISRHGMRFHTHPQMWYMADPSVKDLDLLMDTNGNVCADAIASTFGINGIAMVSYTMKVEDDNVDVEETVSEYLDTMEQMAIKESDIYLQLKEEGVLDFNSDWLSDTDIEEAVSKRVSHEKKERKLRQVSSQGYRLEGSWEVMRY